MNTINRRQFFQRSVAGIAAAWGIPRRSGAAAEGCTLSIGTYAMQGMAAEEAIALVGGLGYDGIEIEVRDGADADSSKVTAERRRGLRELLKRHGLQLTSLMEHLYPSENDGEHAEQVQRLRTAAALAKDLASAHPPLVQTVLGGGVFEEKRDLYVRRLADWTAAMREADVVLAIKPHRGGGLSQPSEAAWLIEHLGKPPWLRMVYDWSHYAFRDLSVEETVKTALPITAHVVVKDIVEVQGKTEFLLPGESGAFDYAGLLRLFFEGGYRGDVCCEVSSQVWRKPDYDAAKAAAICYRNMARAFEEAQIPRG